MAISEPSKAVMAQPEDDSMLFCPQCKQLEPIITQRHDDDTVTYLCKKCGGSIPLRRDLRPGEIVAGFEIEEELGRGAMGIVYQARQTNLDREVAIKILSDDSASDEVYVERFFREARAAASLSHPNVVQAYDAGVTADGIYYFVMEKVTGENLELVLNNVGPLNIQQAMDIFISVAGALSYAWTRNQLSHGDIKPENIIMRLNGKVKLADFGLARRAKDPELADEDIRATPAYAPPEIIRGDKNVPGFKSDMYSFGATAYHILIGHEPFVGTDPLKVCDMQLSDVQVPLSELDHAIPKRLSDLVDALMEKDPAKRPETWDAVEEELKGIREELQGQSSGGGSGTKESHLSGRSGSKKKQAVIAAAVFAAVVSVALLIIVFLETSRNQQPDSPSASGQASVPGGSASGTGHKPGATEIRDKEYYLARWKMMQADFSGGNPDLDRLEAFIAEAGDKAPEEASKTFATLRTKSLQSRALMLRNELLDKAASFRPEDVNKMDFEQLNDLLVSLQSKCTELETIDKSLPEHIYLPEQKKKVDAYVKRLANIQLAKSLGGELSSDAGAGHNYPESSGNVDPRKQTASGNGASGADHSKYIRNQYTLLLKSLPDILDNETERAAVLEIMNEFLSDPASLDETMRTNCNGIRKFLLLNQSQLLPYLANNKNVLRGVQLFPKSYPECTLEEINDNTFSLRVPERDTYVTKNVAWSRIRRNEGEDQIIVTLINNSLLANLSSDFREYLYVRAIFLGVDPGLLKKRYERASGLPKSRLNELDRIAGLFQPR